MRPLSNPQNAPDADGSFARFCTAGDSEDLARVFDLTAPKLILVAMHLVQDAAAAEDLLQTTFVEAIQSAKAFEAGRPVLPWLLTIMARRAANVRRNRARQRTSSLDACEPIDSTLGPGELLVQKELLERVSQSVSDLSSPYREVLVLRLVHSLEPLEIAHVLARPPGTVHAQLHRGLQLLRRALPKGIATTVALLVANGRGLAAVRREVMAALPVTGSATVALAVGGWMMKRLILAAVAVVTLGFVGVWWLGDSKPLSEEESRLTSPIDGALAAAAAAAGEPSESAAAEATRAVYPPSVPSTAPGEGPPCSAVVDTIRIIGECVDPHGLPAVNARVSVRAWLKKKPFSPADARLGVQPNGALDRSAAVGRDGAFEIVVQRRVKVQHRFEAKCAGYVSWVWEAGYLDEDYPDGVLDLGKICLFPAVEFRAKVLTADGRPLQAVFIELRAAAAQSVNGVRTGADGRSVRSLVLRRAVWRISLRGEGAVRWQPESIDLTQVGRKADLEIRAECSLPVTGRVVDEAGAPIPYCNVLGRKSASDYGLGPFCGTDEDGRFCLFSRNIGELNPRPVDLQRPIVLVTQKKGFERTASKPLRWGAEGVRMVVRREARIRLRVRSAKGPVTRYVVCAGPVDRGVHFDGVRSSADGWSEVCLPTRGLSHLWVVPEDLALSPIGPIEVVVPLPASSYKFSPRSKTIFGSKGRPWLWQRSKTDAKGEAQLWVRVGHDPAASDFWLCVKSPGGQSQVVRLDLAGGRQVVMLPD